MSISGALAASSRIGKARGVQRPSPTLLKNRPVAVWVRGSIAWCRTIYCKGKLDPGGYSLRETTGYADNGNSTRARGRGRRGTASNELEGSLRIMPPKYSLTG